MIPQNLRFRFSNYFDTAGRALRPLRVEGHAHTDFTDGQSPAEECVARALELNLDILVFAEHARCGAPWLDDYFQEIRKLKIAHAGRLRIVCGVEARAMSPEGELDADERAQTEAVTAAVEGVGAVDNQLRLMATTRRFASAKQT
jgi:histidinol phosphatase-like PHP family hydrolase